MNADGHHAVCRGEILNLIVARLQVPLILFPFQRIQDMDPLLGRTSEEGAVVQCDAEELACLLKGAFQAWLARWRSGDISSGLQESFPRFLKLIRPMLAGR